MRFEGRTAIVTGAAQGLGAEYAARLAAEGAQVVIVDLKDGQEIVRGIRERGGQAIALQADVTDADALKAMVSSVESTFGTIDILINNAAVVADLQMMPLLQISSEQWSRVMRINAQGTFECTKAVAPVMIRQNRGKIVNIASTTFYKGSVNMAHYVASKGAVIGFTKVAARELGACGITVNCVAPGLTMTPQLREHPGFAGAVSRAAIETRAIRREQTPQDLVGAVLFLSSADSDFISGQTLVVDGGASMP